MEFKAENKLHTRQQVGVGTSFRHDDGFSGVGHVHIRSFRWVDGEKRYEEDIFKSNLIVQQGRATLLDYLSGVYTKRLKYIRWGKGGALPYPDGDPLAPLAVQDTDTNVSMFLIDKLLGSPTRPTSTQLVYTETLISDEIDDDVNEAAMMFEDTVTFNRTMFARVTFPTVRLTSDRGIGIELRWTFNFSRSEQS